jgi:hypothetical protein
MPYFRLLGVVTLLLSFYLAPAWAQRAPVPNSNAPAEHTELEQEMQKNAQKQQQKKRFEDIKRDSRKLLELATELKQHVDQSGENILSMDVMRKAEEMEKLAHKVKENMRAN